MGLVSNRRRTDTTTLNATNALHDLRMARAALADAQRRYDTALGAALDSGATRRSTAAAAGLSLTALQRRAGFTPVPRNVGGAGGSGPGGVAAL
jgi:hypothetical protein